MAKHANKDYRITYTFPEFKNKFFPNSEIDKFGKLDDKGTLLSILEEINNSERAEKKEKNMHNRKIGKEDALP